MKGKLVRVVDEESMYCGNVVEVMGHAKDKLHGQVSWKDANAIFFEKGEMSAFCLPRCEKGFAIGRYSETTVDTLETIAVQR